MRPLLRRLREEPGSAAVFDGKTPSGAFPARPGVRPSPILPGRGGTAGRARGKRPRTGPSEGVFPSKTATGRALAPPSRNRRGGSRSCALSPIESDRRVRKRLSKARMSGKRRRSGTASERRNGGRPAQPFPGPCGRRLFGAFAPIARLRHNRIAPVGGRYAPKRELEHSFYLQARPRLKARALNRSAAFPFAQRRARGFPRVHNSGTSPDNGPSAREPSGAQAPPHSSPFRGRAAHPCAPLGSRTPVRSNGGMKLSSAAPPCCQK